MFTSSPPSSAGSVRGLQLDLLARGLAQGLRQRARLGLVERRTAETASAATTPRCAFQSAPKDSSMARQQVHAAALREQGQEPAP